MPEKKPDPAITRLILANSVKKANARRAGERIEHPVEMAKRQSLRGIVDKLNERRR